MAGVGERIRKRRLELGWTQDQLCTESRDFQELFVGFGERQAERQRHQPARHRPCIERVARLPDDRRGSEKTVTEVPIPASLARFAAEERLSFRQTLDVAGHAEADRGPPQCQEEGRPGVGGLAEVLRGREGVPGERMTRLDAAPEILDLAAELGVGAAKPVDGILRLLPSPDRPLGGRGPWRDDHRPA